jgi:hypothetical protein
LHELPRLRAWLEACRAITSEPAAIVLDLTDTNDSGVLWEVANSVSDSCVDFFVSDPDCAELYTIHHHDKIVACLPDPVSRAEMLRELEQWDDVLEDCSGYENEQPPA